MRRGRPLGLLIALWACTLLYGLLPLALSIFYLAFRGRTNSPVEPRVWLMLAISIGFLGLMIPAWLGRPPQIRLVLTGAVLTLAILNVGMLIGDLSSQPASVLDPEGVGSGATVNRTLDQCTLPFAILVPLYILWYLNRHPSRAYYGGTGRGVRLDSHHVDE